MEYLLITLILFIGLFIGLYVRAIRQCRILTRKNDELLVDNKKINSQHQELQRAVLSMAESVETYKNQYDGAMAALGEYEESARRNYKLAQDMEYKFQQLNSLYTIAVEDNAYYRMLITGDVDNWN